jgi:hypothetical protein
MPLTYDILRDANTLRLPQFKNKHGDPAHSTLDGSDWSPAEWLLATFGELGELAEARIAYDNGDLSAYEFEKAACKEAADVAIYFDIVTRRMLDVTEEAFTPDHAQVLMRIIASLGKYANERKKYTRGDHKSYADFQRAVGKSLETAIAMIRLLQYEGVHQRPCQKVTISSEIGIDLGEAIIDKFNEVSERVGSDVFITEKGENFKRIPR